VEYKVKISPLYRLLLLRYEYIQQFVDGPTATPTHSYVYYMAALGSLVIYRHAQYSKISKWEEYKVKISSLQFQCRDKYWPQILRNQKYLHGSGVLKQFDYSVPLWCLHIPVDADFKIAFLTFKVAISALSSIFSWNGKYRKLVFNIIMQFKAKWD
jgi:hypothetical protein